MKPFRSFLIVFIIIAGYLVVFYVLSNLRKSTPTQIEEAGMPFSAQDSLLQESVIQKNDTPQQILAQSIPSAPKDSSNKQSPPQRSLLSAPPLTYSDTLSFRNNKSGILFPSGDSTILYPFFKELRNRSLQDSSIRVMYYGDSQLEGDRITATIRKNWQQKFGGAGIGLIPPDLLYNLTHSFTVNRSDNWEITNFKDFSKQHKNHSYIFKEASLLPRQEGWFKIKPIGHHKNPNDYLQLQMFYLTKDSLRVTLNQEGSTITAKTIAGGEKIQSFKFNFPSTPPGIELFLKTKDSLIITGFSLETKSGLLVDNISLRGLSYPPFSSSDKETLKETTGFLNPSLCILQYGVNIAPYYQNNYKNYHYYRSLLIREIRTIQRLMPKVPILIISISDMAKREKGEMISYPNIQSIKKAQWDAALQCNCAFFDMENFMGGPGSMIKWVNSTPRLGQKDYIHFTRAGTEKIGNHLSKLIMENYEKYLTIETTE